MSGIYPIINGQACQYPLMRSITHDTGIATGQNGTEQRYKRRGALLGATLQYSNISIWERNKIDSFVSAQKGAFDSTWMFSLTNQCVNGGFTNGLAGWSASNNTYNAWTFGAARYWTRGGEMDGVLFNNPVTVNPGSPAAGSLGSSNIPCFPGQSFSISYWVAIARNGGLPGTIAVGFFPFIRLLDVAGNYISDQTPVVQLNDVGGFLQYTFTYIIPAFPTCTQFQFFIQGLLTNTSGSPIFIPYFFSAIAISDVQIFPLFARGVYGNCGFEQDQIVWTESHAFPHRWSGAVKFRQTANSGLFATPVAAVFPTIATGKVVGYPYSPGYRFFTDRSDMPAGPRVTFAWFAAGLSSFPTAALKNWGFSYTSVTDADLAVLENHYLYCGGKYLPFTFTDPDTNIVYNNVRYDMDSLDVTHRSINANDFKITLAEFA